MFETLSKLGNSKLCSWYYCSTKKNNLNHSHILLHKISQHPNYSKLRLLNRLDVIQWIFKDFTFLGLKHNKKTWKHLEDTWGLKIMSQFSHLKIKKQWTTKFGEYLAEDIFLLLNQQYNNRPMKYKNFQVDGETKTSLYEIKTGTYFTPGTAHEKILGTPYKYRELPLFYKKSLRILCIREIEQYGEEQKLFSCDSPMDINHKAFHDLYKTLNIEYVKFTDMLNEFNIRN